MVVRVNRFGNDVGAVAVALEADEEFAPRRRERVDEGAARGVAEPVRGVRKGEALSVYVGGMSALPRKEGEAPGLTCCASDSELELESVRVA